MFSPALKTLVQNPDCKNLMFASTIMLYSNFNVFPSSSGLFTFYFGSIWKDVISHQFGKAGSQQVLL